MTPVAQVLLVEDNPDEVQLTRLAFEEAEFSNNLSVTFDGEQALRFLRRADSYATAPRPDLVLLDLNLPRLNGHEVLQEIKSDPSLRQIPVVMFTTSGDDRDIARAYDEHVNAYIQKPVGFSAMIDVARTLEGFWMGTVLLPPVGVAGR